MRKMFRQSLLLLVGMGVSGAFVCQSLAPKPEISLSRPAPQESESNLSRSVSSDREMIKSITEKLIGHILDENPAEIIALAHPEKTIFVDVKAEMTPGKLATEWSDQKSMLYALYWNTPLYRQISGDPQALCFRDILKKARTITLDVAIGPDSAVVWLSFAKRPSPMMMGDLTFEKIGGRWFLRGLF